MNQSETANLLNNRSKLTGTGVTHYTDKECEILIKEIEVNLIKGVDEVCINMYTCNTEANKRGYTMNISTITKTLNKKDINDITMSLGFRRYLVLPNKVKKNIGIAFLLKNGSTNHHNTTVSFFENMTENEYYNYLKEV